VVPQDVLIGAERSPTVNCQVGPAARVVTPPFCAVSRQNHTPGARSVAGAPLVPTTSKVTQRCVRARSRQSSTRAPSPPERTQRSVGRREVTVDVDAGAIGRGAFTSTHAPPTRQASALQMNAQREAAQTATAFAGLGHTVPHAPQWFGSLERDTHDPPQFVAPAPQDAVHAPAEHTVPAPHARPQAPQLALSVERFVQVPEQSVRPAPQVVPQRPPEHTVPAPHAMPHAPQCRLSVERSRQVPEHSVCPPGHETTQRPAAQTWPLAQAIPQAPQFRRSSRRSRQAPAQAVKPAAQVTAHAPAEHTVPAPDALPQAPQCPLSVERSRQVPAQSVKPAAHDTLHTPPEQT
jgi:hypothetical protein